jgi:hypothetical protein
MEAVMRLAFRFLIVLFIAVCAFGQPRVTIDKMDDKDISKASKEASFSSLLEGTVDDPNLVVYVLVSYPNKNGWRPG